nr:hypothetical protein Itr_chr14CG10900 [Ipomoea trifida]
MFSLEDGNSHPQFKFIMYFPMDLISFLMCKQPFGFQDIYILNMFNEFEFPKKCPKRRSFH